MSMALQKRFEEAHVAWVTDPAWPMVKAASIHPHEILEGVSREHELMPEALEVYLRGLGYPHGPYTHIWEAV